MDVVFPGALDGPAGGYGIYEYSRLVVEKRRKDSVGETQEEILKAAVAALGFNVSS